jgi:hypothetical protein
VLLLLLLLLLLLSCWALHAHPPRRSDNAV